MPKYIEIVKAALANGRARLDRHDRLLIVCEMQRAGIHIPAKAGDAYIAKRYDVWSDEARAASIEARKAGASADKATDKAFKSGKLSDHRVAAAAHSKAADLHRAAGNDKSADSHETAHQEHMKIITTSPSFH